MQADYARQYRTLWERHWWWRSREAHVLSWIKRLKRKEPAHWRILDVGCGDGLFFESLSRFGEVEGIEPDPSLVNNPRWRDRIHVARIDQDSASLRTGNYNLVLMLDVLEHIDDERAALRALYRSLRPGGRLLLTVPALSCLWSRHDEVNAHFRRYDPVTLRSLLVENGFQVESLRFFFGWTVLPLLVRRWLSPAGRRVKGDHAVGIPPAILNRFLTLASTCEHALGRFIPLPLGSSLLAVVRKADLSDLRFLNYCRQLPTAMLEEPHPDCPVPPSDRHVPMLPLSHQWERS